MDPGSNSAKAKSCGSYGHGSGPPTLLSIIIVLVVFQLEENPEDCGGRSICEPGESGAEEVRQSEAGGCAGVPSHPRSHSPPGAG